MVEAILPYVSGAGGVLTALLAMGKSLRRTVRKVAEEVVLEHASECPMGATVKDQIVELKRDLLSVIDNHHRDVREDIKHLNERQDEFLLKMQGWRK